MKTYRFKNRKEFKKEFGPRWRKQVPYSWPEKMDHLLGQAVSKDFYDDVIKNDYRKPTRESAWPKLKGLTIHKSMLTFEKDGGEQQIEYVYRLINYQDKAVDNLNTKLNQLQAESAGIMQKQAVELNKKYYTSKQVPVTKDKLKSEVGEIRKKCMEEFDNSENIPNLLDKAKDDAAKDEGYYDWNDMLKCLFDPKYGNPGMHTLDDIVNKAIRKTWYLIS